MLEETILHDKGNIWRAAISVQHPVAEVGTDNGSPFVLASKRFERKKEASHQSFMLKVVFRTHHQLPVHDFAFVAIVRQSLNLLLSPNFRLIFDERAHTYCIHGAPTSTLRRFREPFKNRSSVGCNQTDRSNLNQRFSS